MDRLGGITQTDLEYMLHDEDAEPMAMPFPLLEKITDYFSDESIIGRGGYAVVHKAVLDNGTVAVKKLSNTHMNEKLFLREVECLMKAKHRNIVRFLGYCSDTQGNIFDYDGKKIMADVRQRLLCYEYLRKGSLDNYIKDSLGELKWRKRYHIIKGICDGLNYLHENYILHLDLKPGNILLDDDMMPKITDFGSSRCLEKGQTRVITKHVAGTIGYLAPECYRSEITITHKVDLYSLGVIIMELLTGKKGCGNIEDVRESWSYKSDILWWEQIRVCAEIGIECIDLIPANRPQSMKHIIDRLLVAESSTHVVPTGGVNKLLALHTSALRFTFEANKVIMCPLQLTNNTNKHVAFRLMDKSGQSSFLRLPLYGVVPPNNPYILIVTTEEKKMLPRKWIIDVILGTAIILGDDKHIKTFQCQPEKYFQDMLNEVQEVKLKALYTLPRDIITSSSKTDNTSNRVITQKKRWGTSTIVPKKRERNKICLPRSRLSSRQGSGEPPGGRNQRVQVALKPDAVSGPNEWMAVLQKGKEFEERVRSTPQEDPLNHHFVPRSPKSPHHGGEDQPEQSAFTADLGGP
ncbi:cysteine-rich receptor-like protein kinase 42 [Hordeum vulgare subsp. vulgare]|uniref:cysteine-rich receptor-like protein kinase 42 n=1 Tax=Hordeum vulgare subsp. vulgare TaxID=112509 RepID=UPI001D1A4E99|nr:cysteine-rich receptor-like protein kinase 42 [Hordeum vulgare subsp. vulgare]